MKKILMINDSGSFGGVQSVFRNIVTNIDLSEFEVDILSGTDGEIYNDIKKLNYNVTFAEKASKNSNLEEIFFLIRFFFVVNKKVKNKKYDIIYSSGLLSNIITGVLSYRYREIKFVWHEHNMQTSTLRKKLLKVLSKRINKIIVVSKAIKDSYFIRDDKVVVVKNGIRCDELDYCKCKSSKIIKLGIVSRIQPGKGHLEVIEAFNKVENSNMELYIIGGAGTKEGEFIEDKIKSIAKDNNRIKLIGFTKEVDKYYKDLDIVIQASTKWDSLPTVLIEAMNYNCALIGTDIGGISEIINSKNGFLISSDNLVDDLIGVLEKLDKKELNKIQISSKEVLYSEFSLNKQVVSILNIIKN